MQKKKYFRRLKNKKKQSWTRNSKGKNKYLTKQMNVKKSKRTSEIHTMMTMMKTFTYTHA